MNTGEVALLVEVKVAAHKQVHESTGLTSTGSQARVAAAQDLIAETAAHVSLAQEQPTRELVDEGTQRSEGMALHLLWLAGLQEAQVEIKELAHHNVVSLTEL